MWMIPFDIFELEHPYPVECWRCGEIDEISALRKVTGNFGGIQVDKEKGEPAWLSDESGWLCPSCADELLEHEKRSEGPEVTAPGPPNEWRFCQSCGKQIDPTQIEVQFCEGCSEPDAAAEGRL